MFVCACVFVCVCMRASVHEVCVCANPLCTHISALLLLIIHRLSQRRRTTGATTGVGSMQAHSVRVNSLFVVCVLCAWVWLLFVCIVHLLNFSSCLLLKSVSKHCCEGRSTGARETEAEKRGAECVVLFVVCVLCSVCVWFSPFLFLYILLQAMCSLSNSSNWQGATERGWTCYLEILPHECTHTHRLHTQLHTQLNNTPPVYKKQSNKSACKWWRGT